MSCESLETRALLTVTFAGIRLDNGDATFQTPIRIAVSRHKLATGDVNRDGIADLVVIDTAVAHVFLGNGNGTFANDIPYSTGLDEFVFALDAYAATGVTVSDFKGDQSQDLLFVSNRYRSGTQSYISIALGNGSQHTKNYRKSHRRKMLHL